MSNTRKWIFYDSMSKTQSNPITTDEAQMAIFKMKAKEWERFYVWTQGWDSWQPLGLFLKSEQTYFVTQFKSTSATQEKTAKHNLIRDVLEMSKVSEDTHKDITKSFTGIVMAEKDFADPNKSSNLDSFDGEELTWSDAKKPEIDFKALKQKMKYGSRAARHDFKIEVLLITPKGRMFKTYSQNISLTGTLLEDNVPFDYHGISFEAVIVNRKARNHSQARVCLKAMTVGEGLTQRLSFHEMSDIQKSTLEALLKDYIDQHTTGKNKAG